MNDDHIRLLAEFRMLADSVLSRVEPILAEFAEGQSTAPDKRTAPDDRPVFGGCSWCPVCALAALLRGEHHELLAVLAGQAAVFLALLREFLDEFFGARIGDGDGDGGPEGGAPHPANPAAEQPRASTFVPINVTVKPT